MARRRGRGKLNPAKVRAIFTSRDPAKEIATKYGVSHNLVYLIQARRIHKTVTENIRAPRRTRRRGRAMTTARTGTVRVDLNKLANAIVKRLIMRLRGKG
jgi:transposase-like protein